MSLNFILVTHGRDILIPGTHREARSFIGVYNQTNNRYKGLYAPAGRNGKDHIGSQGGDGSWIDYECFMKETKKTTSYHTGIPK